jgi:CheY-like chemotaxis protein
MAIRAKEPRLGGHQLKAMITASTELGEAPRFKRAGADGYIAKPFTQDLFNAELARLSTLLP